jgi:diguanylate cyclase (GGDEF)-like protein
MDLWLPIALLADTMDIVVTLGSGARYSFGWYGARIASMVSACTLLGMLTYESSGIYLRLSDAHRALRESSKRDGMTGVYNRAYFDQRYRHEIGHAAAAGELLSILLIDVDHFKAYNDAFGRLAGDGCLRTIAQTLGKVLRQSTDFVARYGGEEFVVVLPACDVSAGLATAERLRNAIVDMNLHGPSSPWRKS